MNCPSFHFPSPSVPRDCAKREIFSEYGTIGSVYPMDKNGKIELLFQKGRSTNSPELCAAGPILPLLPPNNYYQEEEPCLGHLKETLEEVKRFVNSMRHVGTKNAEKLKNPQEEIFASTGQPSRFKKSISQLTGLTEKYRDKPHVPVVNTDYTGGCLSAVQTSDKQYLICPTGAYLDSLSLYELNTSGRPALTQITTKKCKRILQVDSSYVNNSCHFGVRSENCCLLYKLSENEEGGLRFKRKRKLFHGTKLLSISMSPYIGGECVTLTEEGELHLWDAKGTSASGTCQVTPRFTDPTFWAQAAFSAHPRQLLVTDQTGVAVWDLRMGPRKEDFFVLPNVLLRKDERIMAGKPHPQNPFYHLIATEESLLMLDHRFPKLPVLHWHHVLSAPPQYLNVVSGALPQSGDDVLFMSSQDHAETLCYQINMSSPGVPPVSTSPPWRLAKPQDIFSLEGAPSTKQYKELVDCRIAAPLIGVACLANSNGQGFSSVQMTSYGDMFGQRFVIGTSDKEKTWCSGPGSSHLRLGIEDSRTVRNWHTELLEVLSVTDKLSKIKKEEDTQDENRSPEEQGTTDNEESASDGETQSEKGKKSKKSKKKPKKSENKPEVKIFHMPNYLQKIVPAVDPAPWCKLCGPSHGINFVNKNDDADSQDTSLICPTCQRTREESHSIYQSAKTGKIYPHMANNDTIDAFLDLDLFESDPERYKSAKSQLLINLWEGNDIKDLLELRDKENKKEDREVEKIIKRRSMETFIGTEENEPGDEEIIPPEGLDETDFALSQSGILGEPCSASNNVVLENPPKLVHEDRDSESSGDSDVSEELTCPDLEKSPRTAMVTPYQSNHGATLSFLSSVSNNQTPASVTQSLSNTPTKRLRLSSESDDMATPLNMFQQLSSTGLSGSFTPHSAAGIGNSFRDLSISMTPKTKSVTKKKPRRSVLGF